MAGWPSGAQQPPNGRYWTGTYPSVDYAPHDFGIRLPGELYILKLGFRGEGDVLKPV